MNAKGFTILAMSVLLLSLFTKAQSLTANTDLSLFTGSGKHIENFYTISDHSSGGSDASLPSQIKFKSGCTGWIGLTATNVATGISGECYILINPEATCGFDENLDAEYDAGNGPAFYCLVGDKKLTTNSIPSYSEETQISFILVPEDGNQYRIEASGLELIGSQVYLYDESTKADQDLSRYPDYTLNTLPGGDTSRFLLHFMPAGISDPVQPYEVSAYASNGMLYCRAVGSHDKGLLLDMQGRMCKSIELSGEGMQAYALNLPAGIYIYKQISGSNTFTKKLMLN